MGEITDTQPAKKNIPERILPLTGARVWLDLAQGYPAFVFSSVVRQQSVLWRLSRLVKHDLEVAVI